MLSDCYAVNTSRKDSRGGLMAWLVCFSAGLFFFYEFFQLNLFDVINQPLRDAFHIDATQLSWMSSTYVWANVLFLIPAGIILDRLSIRKVILFAMFLCVIGTIGFALTSSFILASWFHALTGLGNAFCFLSCVVLVSRWFPSRRQALVIGCLVTMAFIGGMMAHTPLARLNEYFGWRHALLIDGAVGILLWIVIYTLVIDFPADQNNVAFDNDLPQVEKQPLIPQFISVLSNPQNWLAGFYTSCLNLPIMVLGALWGASYLKAVYHISQIQASNIVSLIFIGSILGCPLIGWLSDSCGRRKFLMIIGALATLIMLVPLMLGLPLSITSLDIIFFGLGFFTSTQVLSYPLIAESNSSHLTGAATGVASVIIMGGGGIGQVAFGMLMQQHAGTINHSYSITDYQFAMWVFPVTVTLALLAVLLVRETYCKHLN